jgi:hypothetical protein
MPRAPQRPRAAPAALSRSPRTETRASSARAARRRVLDRPPLSPLLWLPFVAAFPRRCREACRASEVPPRPERRSLRGHARRRARRRCGCGHGNGCGPASLLAERRRMRDFVRGAALGPVALAGATPSAKAPKAPRQAPRLAPRSATSSWTGSRRTRARRGRRSRSRWRGGCRAERPTACRTEHRRRRQAHCTIARAAGGGAGPTRRAPSSLLSARVGRGRISSPLPEACLVPTRSEEGVWREPVATVHSICSALARAKIACALRQYACRTTRAHERARAACCATPRWAGRR